MLGMTFLNDAQLDWLMFVARCIYNVSEEIFPICYAMSDQISEQYETVLQSMPRQKHQMSDTEKVAFYEQAHLLWCQMRAPHKAELVSLIADLVRNKQAQRVIDVGCGNGDLITFLTKMGFVTGEITAIDGSTLLINEAQKIAQTAKANIDFQQCQINELGQNFPANYFDLTLSIDVIHYCADLARSLREIAAITSTEGTLVIVYQPKNKWCLRPGKIMDILARVSCITTDSCKISEQAHDHRCQNKLKSNAGLFATIPARTIKRRSVSGTGPK